MQFPQLMEIVDEEWRRISKRFHMAFTDEYVIMPNHFHGIVIINNEMECRQGGYPQGVSLQNVTDIINGKPNLGTIVGSFKSLCVNAWLKVITSRNNNARGKFWQSNYYEHIIRSEDELNRIRNYIIDNPLKWESDRENPVNQNRPGTKQAEEWMV